MEKEVDKTDFEKENGQKIFKEAKTKRLIKYKGI